VAETTVRRLLSYAAGFDALDKAMRQVYRCWWRIYQEINAFSRFEYHMFYAINQFVTYLLTIYGLHGVISQKMVLFKIIPSLCSKMV
jgi:hypothetical protein